MSFRYWGIADNAALPWQPAMFEILKLLLYLCQIIPKCTSCNFQVFLDDLDFKFFSCSFAFAGTTIMSLYVCHKNLTVFNLGDQQIYFVQNYLIPSFSGSKRLSGALVEADHPQQVWAEPWIVANGSVWQPYTSTPFNNFAFVHNLIFIHPCRTGRGWQTWLCYYLHFYFYRGGSRNLGREVLF